MKSTFMASITAGVFVVVFPCGGDLARAEDDKTAPSAKVILETANHDPITTYRTYLVAVKRDDPAAAKECFSINTPVESLARDITVELWIAHHRFQKLVSATFEKQEDCPYWRPDCTDQAIDRTIALLATATCTIEGDSAELKIDWPTDDEALFGCTGDEPFSGVGPRNATFRPHHQPPHRPSHPPLSGTSIASLLARCGEEMYDRLHG